jgi:hypothetical protein
MLQFSLALRIVGDYVDSLKKTLHNGLDTRDDVSSDGKEKTTKQTE